MPRGRGTARGRWASVIASAGMILLAAAFALFLLGPLLADSYRDSPDETPMVVDAAVDASSAMRDYLPVFLALACCLTVVTVVAFVVALRDGRPPADAARRP